MNQDDFAPTSGDNSGHAAADTMAPVPEQAHLSDVRSTGVSLPTVAVSSAGIVLLIAGAWAAWSAFLGSADNAAQSPIVASVSSDRMAPELPGSESRKSWDAAQSNSAPVRSSEPDQSIHAWHDLLPEAALGGSWKRTAEGLFQSPPIENQVCQIAADIHSSYQLRTSFTRNSGENSVNYYFPVGAEIGIVYFDIVDTDSLVIDGKYAGDSPVVRQNVPIISGHKYSVVIDVEVNGQNARIDVKLDGQKHLSWSGAKSHLASTHPSGRFSVGSRDGDTVFHELLIGPLPNSAKQVTVSPG